jgi:hypothetical protein
VFVLFQRGRCLWRLRASDRGRGDQDKHNDGRASQTSGWRIPGHGTTCSSEEKAKK